MKLIAFLLFLLGSGFALYILILESRRSAERTLNDLLTRDREFRDRELEHPELALASPQAPRPTLQA